MTWFLSGKGVRTIFFVLLFPGDLFGKAKCV